MALRGYIALALVLYAAVAVRADTAECSIEVTLLDAGAGAPKPVCSSVCANDQGKVWYDGVAFKRIPSLKENYGLMVEVNFVGGDVADCKTVPFATDAELSEQHAALEECLADAGGNSLLVLRCPDGYTQVGTSCYLVTPTTARFGGGSKHCSKMSGYTAIINDAEEQDSLAAVLPDTVYIAVNDKDVEGDFRNPGLDGAAYLNFNTAGGEPNNVGDEDCVLMKHNLNWMWNDVKCTTTKHMLCEADPTVEEVDTPYVCPEGSLLFGTSCYQITPAAGSYAEGEAYCQQKGGHPVYVNSDDEMSFLAGVLQESVFMDLTLNSGNFVAGDFGRPIYSNWAVAPAGAQSCSIMNAQDGFKWQEASCSMSLRTLCEAAAAAATMMG